MLSEANKILLNIGNDVNKNVDLNKLGLIGINIVASLRALCLKGNGPKSVVCAVNSEIENFNESIFNFSQAIVASGDLTKGVDFLKNFGDFDYIIHAAGYGQPGKFMADPVKTLKLNTSTTIELFELLKNNGNFLFLSTSEVYSGLDFSPHKESDIGSTNTYHPRGCYIEAKRCGEAICCAFNSKGFNARSARVALSFGPGTKKDDHRVINQFIQRALTENKINLMDMGEAKRTYCYVSDTVEILWNIILNGNMPVYNVGGMSKTTIAELAKLIGKLLSVDVFFPNIESTMSDAPLDVSLDMHSVHTEFNKDNYVDFQIGLSETIKFQEYLYKN
jgi:UDP-glucuronate decarboxylase